MSSTNLLHTYITKYKSFRGVDKEISRLYKMTFPLYNNYIIINKEITILLNLLTATQFNGLIRHTFINMKRDNKLCMNDDVGVLIPIYIGDSSRYDFIRNLFATRDFVLEYFILSLYTYF